MEISVRCLVCALGVSVFGSPAVVRAQFLGPYDQFMGGTESPALNYTADDVLVVPDDGVLRVPSFTIASGVVVTVQSNPTNDPLMILSQGDIVIDGILDVSGEDASAERPGEGGPGGFRGGYGAPASGLGAGAGLGPGAYLGGLGSYRLGTAAYGSTLVSPLVGGSGGGGVSSGSHGGGGGGAVLLGSNTQIVMGTGSEVRAFGGRGHGSGSRGTGGAIRLVAPLVSGAGKLDVSSDGGHNHNHAGYVRIDSFDPSLATGIVSGPANILVYGSWMEVDPFRTTGAPTLSITQIQAGNATWPIDGSHPNPLVTEPQSVSTVEVTVQYENFSNDFSVEVVLTPEFNPNGTSVLVPHRVVKSVVYNELNPPADSCGTDAQGTGTCVFSMSYTPNVMMDVAAYIRSF